MAKMKIGDRFWWKKGWRWLWYVGNTPDGKYIFEDAGDVVFHLTSRDVGLLELTGWRDAQ